MNQVVSSRIVARPAIRYYFLFTAIVTAALWVYPHFNIFSLTGIIILLSGFFTVLYLFLLHFSPDVLKSELKTFFLLLLLVTYMVLIRIALQYPGRHYINLIPFTIAVILVRTFYDARLAFFILIQILLIAGFFIDTPLDFILINSIAGIVAVFTLRGHRKGKLFYTALYVFITMSGIYTSLKLFREGTITGLEISAYTSIFLNSALLILSYPAIFFFEKRFMYLSDSTLLEYADTNQPLLRKMAEEAPGSFQHSLQVANLAEEAARITGANPLLARVGALYHDIGKIAAPLYYIENQKSGVSPHDNLDPDSSARYIINHVNSGVILARNYKLPQPIIDFIRTHHGTSIAYYFYRKFTEKRPWDSFNISDFMYPGPKPFSKETGIIMMADAVEASSRSIEKQTEEDISQLVERIILLQDQDGQYSNVPFTYKEISDIKEVFKKTLMTMYHGRIVYPNRLS
ncbi:MAG TPA: HDIG domain-containing protein [Bacteroidales bacterium]|nr:HDIG domain-containing protein [Bacteroidales bacterium]